MTFVTILSADLLGEVAEDLILELSNKMLMLFVEFRNYDIDTVTVSIQTIFEEKLNVIHRTCLKEANKFFKSKALVALSIGKRC